MASALGSAPPIAACAHNPAACRPHATSSVDRSRPANPGITRRAGTTIQLVVASRNSPMGLRNGTRSHWKWKRASSKNTRKETIVSMRNVAIWANISVLCQLVAELMAAPGCRGERARKAFGELLLLEGLQRRLRRAAFGGHLGAQRGGRLAALRRELGRAEHRMGGELERLGTADAGTLGERGELLDQPEDVGRAATRHRRDGIEQRFVLHPYRLADRREDALGTLTLGVGDLRKRVQAGDAGTHQRRRVRHAPHEAAMAVEPARERREPQAGADADEQLAANGAGNRGERGTRVLRLHGEHQRIGFLARRVGRRAHAHAVRGDALARRRADLDDKDRARVVAAAHQPADQCVGHVAAAEKSNAHAACFSLRRSPKIAVPTRTSVAPSAIASSRSSDMPIDNVSTSNSWLSLSYVSRTSR